VATAIGEEWSLHPLGHLFFIGTVWVVAVGAMVLKQLVDLYHLPEPVAIEWPFWKMNLGLVFILLGLASGYLALAISPRFPFLLVAFIVFTDAIILAVALTRYLFVISPLLNRRYAKVWVKALDFPYLALGFIGVARFINTPTMIADQLAPFDFVALMAITMAIGIRLSKAIIEVFFPRWF
jgi:hypothetical protein